MLMCLMTARSPNDRTFVITGSSAKLGFIAKKKRASVKSTSSAPNANLNKRSYSDVNETLPERFTVGKSTSRESCEASCASSMKTMRTLCLPLILFTWLNAVLPPVERKPVNANSTFVSLLMILLWVILKYCSRPACLIKSLTTE